MPSALGLVNYYDVARARWFLYLVFVPDIQQGNLRVVVSPTKVGVTV